MNDWLNGWRKNIPAVSSQTSSRHRQESHKLGTCRIRYAILFSMISPIIGYSYTGRFAAMCGFLVSSIIIGLVLTQSDLALDINSRKVKIGLGLSIAVVAAVDNSRAILVARKESRKT